MRSIPTVPATAPPNSAPPSGSPPTERTGAEGDFAATLTNIATARTATAEGRLTDASGRLLAHGTTTCLIFDIPTK